MKNKGGNPIGRSPKQGTSILRFEANQCSGVREVEIVKSNNDGHRVIAKVTLTHSV